MAIYDSLQQVHEKIEKSAVRSGRRPEDIKLVAVTKTVEIEKILEAVKAGASILGENRVQEAKDKITDFRALTTPPAPPVGKGGIKGGVEWHLIGNLQKNKARAAVELFDLIQSVDSIGLAEELDKSARKAGKKQRVLVQAKLSDEPSKHGVSESGLTELLEKIMNSEYLKLEGLMTIPPFFDDPEKARPYFRKLRQLAVMARDEGFPVNELSMGMTNDFEIAVEEGATMVRVGTAIFGERKR